MQLLSPDPWQTRAGPGSEQLSGHVIHKLAPCWRRQRSEERARVAGCKRKPRGTPRRS